MLIFKPNGVLCEKSIVFALLLDVFGLFGGLDSV